MLAEVHQSIWPGDATGGGIKVHHDANQLHDGRGLYPESLFGKNHFSGCGQCSGQQKTRNEAGQATFPNYYTGKQYDQKAAKDALALDVLRRSSDGDCSGKQRKHCDHADIHCEQFYAPA